MRSQGKAWRGAARWLTASGAGLVLIVGLAPAANAGGNSTHVRVSKQCALTNAETPKIHKGYGEVITKTLIDKHDNVFLTRATPVLTRSSDTPNYRYRTIVTVRDAKGNTRARVVNGNFVGKQRIYTDWAVTARFVKPHGIAAACNTRVRPGGFTWTISGKDKVALGKNGRVGKATSSVVAKGRTSAYTHHTLKLIRTHGRLPGDDASNRFYVLNSHLGAFSGATRILHRSSPTSTATWSGKRRIHNGVITGGNVFQNAYNGNNRRTHIRLEIKPRA